MVDIVGVGLPLLLVGVIGAGLAAAVVTVPVDVLLCRHRRESSCFIFVFIGFFLWLLSPETCFRSFGHAR